MKPNRIIPILAVLLAIPSSGCGLIVEGGAYAIYVWMSEDDADTEEQDSLPAVISAQITSDPARRDTVVFAYVLADPGGESADMEFEFSDDSGTSWSAMTDTAAAPSEGVASLSTSVTGVNHVFAWDIETDLPKASNWNAVVRFRFTPFDGSTGDPGTPWTSADVTVNVNHVPFATGISPSGDFPDGVPLQYILVDQENDAADVAVEYSLNGTTWYSAARKTGVGEGTTGLTATTTGSAHTFVWDAGSDLAGQANIDGVTLRITPSDTAAPGFVGSPWVSNAVDHVNHNTAPTINASTPADVSDSQTVLSFDFAIIDSESQNTDILVEYEVGGAGSWETASESSSGSDGTSDLTAVPSPGSPHVFVWDFHAGDGLTTADTSVRIRITPRDHVLAAITSPPWTSNSFLINKSALAHTSVVSVNSPTGTQVDTVTVQYTLVDDFDPDGTGPTPPTGHAVDITVQYSTNGGGSWATATEATWESDSEGKTSLSADPDGETHTFVWSAFSDLSGQDHPLPPGGQGIVLRITSTEYGNFSDTDVFAVLNSWMETVKAGGGGALYDPAEAVLDSAGNVYICDTFNSRVLVLNAQATTQAFMGVSVAPNTMATIAGSGASGYNGDNITALSADLNYPRGIALDGSTPPNLFIADTLNHRIRRVDGNTGFITTMAGTGAPGYTGDQVLATLANLDNPEDVAFDLAGNLWIADTGNHALKMVNPGSASVSSFGLSVAAGTLRLMAGSDSAEAGFVDNLPMGDAALRFASPRGIAFDAAGSLYVCDSANHRVRFANNTVSTINIANQNITPDTIRVIAGSGVEGYSGEGALARAAKLRFPEKIAACGTSNHFVFSDTGNHRVRAVDAGAGDLVIGSVTITANKIKTVAGGGTDLSSGISSITARLQSPRGIALDADSPQNLYIADSANNRLLALNASPSATLTGVATAGGSTVSINAGAVAEIAGTAPTGLRLLDVRGLAISATTLYIADAGANQVLALDLATRTLSLVAGTGTPGDNGDGADATLAELNEPTDVALNSAGTLLVVTDTGNNQVRVVNLSASQQICWGITVEAGEIEAVYSGAVTQEIEPILAAKIDRQGWTGTVDTLYVADRAGHEIVQILPGGTSSTVAGSGTETYDGGDEGGPATDFNIGDPAGLCVRSDGLVYVTDRLNHRVYAFTVGGTCATVAGTGTAGYNGDNLQATSTDLNSPAGLCLDGSGNLLIIETENHVIRRLSGGVLTLVAGTTLPGFNGDRKPGVNSQLNLPVAGTSDGDGHFYFSDGGNRRIRRFKP